MTEINSIGEVLVIILICICVLLTIVGAIVITNIIGEAMSDNYRSKHPEETYDD